MQKLEQIDKKKARINNEVIYKLKYIILELENVRMSRYTVAAPIERQRFIKF